MSNTQKVIGTLLVIYTVVIIVVVSVTMSVNKENKYDTEEQNRGRDLPQEGRR